MSIEQAELKEGLTVQSSDREWLGTIDHVEGDTLKLKKSDSADGQHHYVPLTLVDREEGGTIFLSCTAVEAKKQWTGEKAEESEVGAPEAKVGSDSSKEGLNINQRKDQPQTLAS